MELSPGTIRRIAILFPEEQRSEVADLLVAECGDNLPFGDKMRAEDVERIRFAALRCSEGSLDRLYMAVDGARQDWRDTLVGAGFGEDETAHLRWLADD